MTQVTTSEPSVATLTIEDGFPEVVLISKRTSKATDFSVFLFLHKLVASEILHYLPFSHSLWHWIFPASLSPLWSLHFHPWLSFLLLLLLKISPKFNPPAFWFSLVTFSPNSILGSANWTQSLVATIISKQIHLKVLPKPRETCQAPISNHL